MRSIAIILLVVGVVALIYGGFSYNRQHTVLEVGDLKATATEHKTVPVPPIVGGIAIVSGIALLVMPRRRVS